MTSQIHDWVVYKMGVILGSVGHRVKVHKITSGTDKRLERGDIEIIDYGLTKNLKHRTTDFLPLVP